jgi:hypothetical protein
MMIILAFGLRSKITLALVDGGKVMLLFIRAFNRFQLSHNVEQLQSPEEKQTFKVVIYLLHHKY